MQIHEIKSSHTRKNKKRIGRGGKRGTTSGRGQKGQRARSGHRIRPAERDIIAKFPKLRGVKNKSISGKAATVDIKMLAEKFPAGDVITKTFLKEHGIIRSLSKKVKILGNEDIKVKFSIEGIPVSLSAKKKIEAAGGSVK